MEFEDLLNIKKVSSEGVEMSRRLLSHLELFLNEQFDNVFMVSSDLLNWQSEDITGEFEKYLTGISDRDIAAVYNRLYMLTSQKS